METYTNTDLPPFWWLRPWHHANRLHAATYALLDEVDDVQYEADRWRVRAEKAEMAEKTGLPWDGLRGKLDEANYEIARLNDELSLANAKVDELTTALQRHAKPAKPKAKKKGGVK